MTHRTVRIRRALNSAAAWAFGALALTACAAETESRGRVEVVQGGEYRLQSEAYEAAGQSATPVLVVVLHGDSPRRPPDYHNRFAAAVAKREKDVIAVGLLRPGYSDPAGHRSEGVQGVSDGDNYNARNTQSLASAIGELKRRWKARRVVAVGHSGGAALIGNMLGKHPGVIDAAVLVSCPCDVPTWRSYMHTLRNRPGQPRVVDTLSPLEVLSGVESRVPIRLLVGANDDITLPAMSAAYATAARSMGKDAEVTILPGVDHDGAMQAEAVLTQIDQFVK